MKKVYYATLELDPHSRQWIADFELAFKPPLRPQAAFLTTG